MLGSAALYSGVVIAAGGLALCVKPIRRIGIATRMRASLIAAIGVLIASGAFLLPVSESRAAGGPTLLDRFTPVWQFHEVHRRRVAAPPPRVFDAIKRVRADEIALFHALTWIRRGGREAPPGILNAGNRDPLLDVATKNGFVLSRRILHASSSSALSSSHRRAHAAS